MRKSTKRVISSVLAASMLFTSVFVNPTYAYAEDSAVVSAYASSLSFTYEGLKGAADKEALAASEAGGFTLTGTVQKRVNDSGDVTAIEVAKNYGGTFSFTADAGDKIAVLFSSTGGSNESELSLNTAADGSGTELVKKSVTGTLKAADTLEYTFTESGTYYIGSPANADLNRGARIYTATLTGSGAAAETTTEATTVAATTEATTVEATTEATTAAVEDSTTAAAENTEATTEAPAVAVGSSYKAVFGDSSKTTWANGDPAYKKGKTIEVDDSVEVIAAQELDYTLKTPAEIASFANGNVYDSWLASTSANTSVSVDGAAAVNYRIVCTIKALKDTTVSLDAKVSGSEKVVVFGLTDDDPEKITNVTSLEVVDTAVEGTPNPDFHTFTADLKEGQVAVLLGKGTNPPLFGIDAKAAGEAEDNGEWDVVFEDLIKDLATGDPLVKKADQVIFDNDEMTVKSCQELDASKEEESVFATSGNTYNRWVASVGTNSSVSVDGASPINYRKVVTVEAKQDGTLYMDVKASGNDKIVVVATGNDADGYTSLDKIETGNPGVTDFHTFKLAVKKGDVITLLGQGTNPPLFGINFVGEGEATTDQFTVRIAQDTKAEYDIDAAKTSESISFYAVNNPGFNNFTVFVKYDPTLIKATSGSWGDLLSGVEGFSENADQINKQIANVPAANNTDYTAVGADGTKTQAELGLIKIAGFSKDEANDYVVSGDGVLFSIDFDILQTVTEKTNTGLELIIVQDGFRPAPGAAEIIDTAVENEVYLVPAEETTTESTTESTSETESASESETEPQTESETEPTTAAATTVATEATEATTAAETETTTEEESVSVETTIVVVTRRTSGGGGGGGSSSSLTKSSTTTTEADVEATTSSRSSNVADAGSFTVTGKNGQDVVINPPTATRPVDEFIDVPASHWAHDSIMKLAELGIVNGVGDNMFAPSAPCKRADFIIMINNTLGITGTAKFNFSDVAAGKYYYNPVGVAYEIGIASGYGDDTFKPENYCTREEMMVLVAKTFEFLGETVTTTSQDNLSVFADRDEISWWAAPYTAYLVDKGMVVGTGANFEPKVYMNRAQLAVLIAQVYDNVVAMAAERGVSADEIVDEIVEEASIEEVDAAAVSKLADTAKANRDEIVEDYYDGLDKDVKANFDARNAEFDELLATITDDISDEDAAKAYVALTEANELFEDIIAEAE